MLKKLVATFVVALVLGLSLCLAGCGDALEATGYQGQLEDGSTFVYIQMDDTIIISVTDEQHQGDDADTYSGKATTDAAGKMTVTDDETGKTISFTLTENSDGAFDADVEGHGKGTLKPYEGDIFSLISEMADDDAEAVK